MGTEDILMTIFFFLIVGVPILGATARFALLPLVETIIRLRQDVPSGGISPSVERWLLRLEDDVSALQKQVSRLTESEQFFRELSDAYPDRSALGIGVDDEGSGAIDPARRP